MKRLTKIIATGLLGLVISTTITPSAITFADVSAPNVEAEIYFTPEQQKLIDEGLTPENISILEKKLENYNAPKSTRQKRSVQTKAVKVAIRAALKNKNKLIGMVGKYIGSDAAASVGSAFKTAEPVLKKLLKYESLAYGTVEGQVSTALIQAGMKSSTARTIAFWIRQGLEWLV